MLKRWWKRRDELARVAEQTFGWERLRPHQREAMEHVVAGHDTLVVLPTGAGKSAIYQVPALLADGPTLVVSPLLALQQDQLEGIGESRAPEAVAINSAQTAAEREHAWEAIRTGAAQYLFLAPEQLANEDTVAEVAELGIALFVVDEAHCVSAWGHDFRPDYLRLGHVVERLGHPTVLAMTATAAQPVRRDIVERLGLHDHREVIASFDRPNLHLRVVRCLEDDQKRREVVARVRDLDGHPVTGRGLLYVATRKDAERYAEELAAEGLRVAAYHAGMRAADRTRVQQDFGEHRIDVVVATSAFGMGIDEPDVRFVVHASAPDSLDSYYQQVGRAGRDGEPASVVLCYRPEDLNLQRFLTGSRAPEDVLHKVARLLEQHDGPVEPAALKNEIDAPAVRRTRAVNLLEQAGAVGTTVDGRLEYLDERTKPAEAVAAAVDVAEARQQLTRSRIEMMRGYAETTDCRRRFLLGYFGEQLPERCGNCDTCDAGSARDEVPEDAEFRVGRAVRHAQWGDGVVTASDDSELTALFEEVGYKTLALGVVRERGLLEVVGPR